MSDLKTLRDNMLIMAHNPAAMLSLSLERLRSVNASEDMILADPTDPVVFLAEQGVLYGHTAIEGMREVIPKTFASQAVTWDDVYRHMNDRSLIDVWSTPSETTLTLYVDIDSIINKSIPADIQVVRSLIIPRDTQWMVSGYTFTTQYPIEIQYLPHSTPEQPACQVLWLTKTQSPIRPVATNALDFEIITIPTMNSRLLRIKIPVMQYAITTNNDTVVADTEFRISRAFTDLYYYSRVWMRKENSRVWVELPTTLSKDNYDPTKPTAYITVGDGVVTANIPSVYMTTGQVNGEIRLDVYSTKGKLELDLASFNESEYTFRFDDLNGEIDPTYYNPLRSMGLFNVLGEEWVRGGANGKTFAEVRQAVVDNAAGDRKIPITDAQLTHRVGREGLQLSRPIDYTPSTGRTFQLSDALPKPTISKLHSPMGSLSVPLYFTLEHLEDLETAKINGNRITITPDTIYITDGTSISIEPEMTRNWRTLPKAELVNRGNTRPYYYTPFHFVVDTNNDMIDVRLYQLNKPVVDSKRFIDTNTTTELSVVTGDYTLEFTDRGYLLRVATKSGQSYQELDDDNCWAQISYKPRGEYSEYVYIIGKYVGKLTSSKERVFEFLIETNLDVDRNDEIIITNGRTPNIEDYVSPVPLLTEFNLFFGVDNYYPHYYQRSDIDSLILPPSRDAKAVTHEIIKIKFGENMKRLWSKSRPETDSIDYKRHEQDVYRVWEEDVKKRNDDLTAVMVKNPETGKLEFVYEHRKGDPVLDENGDPIIKATAGSLIYDANGNPIIAKPRSIVFRCEMPVFDARFIFADSREIVLYRERVVQHVVDRVTSTVPMLAKEIIDMSDAYYLPTPTMGYLQARLQDGSVAPIPAENRFTISYYLTAANRKDTKLLELIKQRTATALSDWLAKNKTISATDLGDLLKDLLKDSIISVEIDDFGPDQNLRLYSIVSDAGTATLGKKLDIEPDNTISLKDDIVVAFNRFDTTL